MSRQALLRLLQQRIGLDAESLGERVVSDSLAEARSALGIADDEALYGEAIAHPQAFSEIVEHFVVPESWFFRAGDQYADLVRFAREQPNRRPLRVLSLPCASGEEAYSAVIALVEAGLAPDDINVLGIDISRMSIGRAQAGVFRSSALRGRSMPDAWTQSRAGGFAIASGIKRCARFRVGNALDPKLLDPSERFDVVFCRNLLIYLLPAARARVLTTLLATLEPGGLLFAGQAEVFKTVGSDLRPYEGGCPLSYIRDPVPLTTAAQEPAPRRIPVERAAASQGPMQPRVDPVGVAAPIESARSQWSPQELSPKALADAGRLEEARTACRLRLLRAPEDIETLFLLGLVESARADLVAAEAAFARVCFLDRDHVPAMDHRIALAERQGRPKLAGELRKRSVRLRKRLGRLA
jgi:chemotaxis protein methyltransferase WspC